MKRRQFVLGMGAMPLAATASWTGAASVAPAREAPHPSASERSQCVPTGMDSLDGAIGGLRRGALIALAANSCVGAARLAFDIAGNVASLPHTGAIVFSAPIGAASVFRRIQARRFVAAHGRERAALGFPAEPDRRSLDHTGFLVDESPRASLTDAFCHVLNMPGQLAAGRSDRTGRGTVGLMVVIAPSLMIPCGPWMSGGRTPAKGLKSFAETTEVPMLVLMPSAEISAEGYKLETVQPRLRGLAYDLLTEADLMLLLDRSAPLGCQDTTLGSHDIRFAEGRTVARIATIEHGV